MALKPTSITLEDRLNFGALTVDEVCALKGCGRTSFYRDVKLGLVSIEKHGRSARVRGHIAKRYLAGGPISAETKAA